MAGAIKIDEEPKKNFINCSTTKRKVPIEKVSIQIENNKNSSLETRTDRRVTIETEDRTDQLRKQLQLTFGIQNDLTNEQIFCLLKHSGLVKDKPLDGSALFFF